MPSSTSPSPSAPVWPYLQGPRLRLRAMEPEDLDLVYAIENDPEAWDMTSLTSPYSRYAIKQYIASAQNDLYADRQVRLMVVVQGGGDFAEVQDVAEVQGVAEVQSVREVQGNTPKQNDVVIGTIDLTDFAPQHARAELGILILRAYRGRGYAREAVEIACRYAFGPLHLHQITVHVAVGNEACIATMRACGFQECGLLRQWWRTPAGFQDVLLLQRLHS